jgi:2-oxoglutarate/2-oxoacid ferredoxin oxidoreductase subunit beta
MPSRDKALWCADCGNYAILNVLSSIIKDLGIPKENFVLVSGIGCSGRFPYYMDTYGFHTIHGRAPTIATGLKLVRPDLEVWLIVGDGDALAIGGNHMIHLLRRNVGVKVLLINNYVYAQTGGQHSPTTAVGTEVSSIERGVLGKSLNPLVVACAAGATFIARSVDIWEEHLEQTLQRAATHKGTAFVEILQGCPTFNQNIWWSEQNPANHNVLFLEHGSSLRFGKNNETGIRFHELSLEIVSLKKEAHVDELLIHDEQCTSPAYPLLLAHMASSHHFPEPFGVLRAVTATCYEDIVGIYNRDDPYSNDFKELDDLLK